MRSVVLTKGVPDFREGQVSFDEDGHLERGKTPTVIPWSTLVQQFL